MFRRPDPVRLSPAEQTQIEALCHSVAGLLHSAGRTTAALSLERKPWCPDIRERLQRLEIYRQVLAEHLAEKNVRDHKTMTWKFLSKMGYAPASDLFDRIEDGDIIEIFNMEGDQIYRNLNYFDTVSLSVEDLVNMNWKRDYKRNQKVNLRLIGLNLRFALGTFHKTYDCSKIPVHRVQEMIGKRYLFDLKLKYLSPIKKDGKCVGVIATSRAHRIKP